MNCQALSLAGPCSCPGFCAQRLRVEPQRPVERGPRLAASDVGTEVREFVQERASSLSSTSIISRSPALNEPSSQSESPMRSDSLLNLSRMRSSMRVGVPRTRTCRAPVP